MKEKTKTKTLLEKAVFFSLVVLNTLFLVYWVILAYYSRLHYDDLQFLWQIREMSVFEFVRYVYHSRSGRFVEYALTAVVMMVTDTVGFHQLWAIFYYAIGLGICWLVVKDFKIPVSKATVFLGMCFVYNLYILTNIDFPVFFWHCAMRYYLHLPMALLLLKYLNKEKLNRWQWAALLVITLMKGGGNEAFTPIVLLLMLVCGLYWWRSKGWKVKETWKLPQVRRIVWIAVLLLVLFAIVVAAPGNYKRMSDSTQFVHPVGLVGWIRAWREAVGMFLYFMAFYIPYYIIAFVLACYVGGKAHIEWPMAKNKMITRLVLFWLIYLVVSSFPNVYLYGGFGIQRTYTHIVLALLVVVMAIGFIIGTDKKSDSFGWLAVGGFALLAVIMCINIAKDTPTAREYGKAVDERIDYLCSLRDKGQKDTVEVAPLPMPYTEDTKHLLWSLLGKEKTKSVLYYVSDTDTQPNKYVYHMRKVFDLDFDFVLPGNAQDVKTE